MRTKLRYAAIAALVMAAAIQFIQPDRTNPPADPAASFEALMAPPKEAVAVIHRACQDCHSNQTVWPWYSRVAPVSWLVAHDVKEGRARLNLSEWNRLGAEMAALRVKAMCQETRKGEMPIGTYKLMHPAARLTEADATALCSVLPASKM